MRVRAFPTLFLTSLLILLAGCSAGDPGRHAAEPLDSSGPSETASPSATGTSEPEGGTSMAVAEDATGRSGVFTVTAAANWTAGYSVADQKANANGSGHPGVTIEAGNLAGAVVEMDWTPSTPLSESLELSVWRLGGRSLGAVEGTAPLRLAFPGDELSGDIVLYVRAHDTGAFVQQEVTYYVTTFEGVPFDAAYTAVPA